MSPLDYAGEIIQANHGALLPYGVAEPPSASTPFPALKSDEEAGSCPLAVPPGYGVRSWLASGRVKETEQRWGSGEATTGK